MRRIQFEVYVLKPPLKSQVQIDSTVIIVFVLSLGQQALSMYQYMILYYSQQFQNLIIPSWYFP